MTNNKGFTLTELMIVVAIIGIISMFAIPSYQNAQRKTKIAHALAELTSMQSQIEKYRLKERKPYKDITLETVTIDPNIYYSNQNLYTVAYEIATTPAEKYVLTATAKGTWLKSDDKCRTLTLNGLGILKEAADCRK